MTAMPGAAWELAHRAADRIVGRPAHASVARAVLAQWIAEHGVQWPFSRNNPGNLARGWAAQFSYPFHVETPNPQPGNPIVTFATQAGGADCYSAGLTAFSRYAHAVTLARAGDGLGFAVAVAEAGYGTRESTIRSVYASLAAPEPPVPESHPGGDNVAVRWAQVRDTYTRMRLRRDQPLYERPGGPQVTAMARAGDVPHIGLAGRVGDTVWRAVLIGTRWSYDDGDVHKTVLYVPASAGEVIDA